MPNEAVHEGNGWSSIGLAGDTGQGRQQSPNQNTSELGVDPYSAAVLQGYNNSSLGYQFAYPSNQSQQYGYPDQSNNYYGTAEEDVHACYHNRMMPGRGAGQVANNVCDDGAGMMSDSQAMLQTQQQPQAEGAAAASSAVQSQSFGIHQPILPPQPQPIQSVGDVVPNAVKSDSRASLLTSTKDRSEERERTSSVEAVTTALQGVHPDSKEKRDFAQEQHKEPSSSVLDAQSATAHSEPPMMQTQVPDIISIGELAPKGSSSCEVVTQGNYETASAQSVVPDGTAYRTEENGSTSSQRLQGHIPQEQNRQPDMLLMGGNMPLYPSAGEQWSLNVPEIVGSSDQRVIYGAEAEKQFEMMKRAQRDVETVEKSGEHLNEAASNASHVDWDSVHSPVAVAQVTPMVATVHSNMVADPIPQSLPAGAVIQQHNALQTPPTMLLPSISSTVMATNVARVDPIPSHPVESQPPSIPRLQPAQQQPGSISTDGIQHTAHGVTEEQFSTDLASSTINVATVEERQLERQPTPSTFEEPIMENEASRSSTTASTTCIMANETAKQVANELNESKLMKQEAANVAEQIVLQQAPVNTNASNETDRKVVNEVVVGSTEHSTDSAAQEDNTSVVRGTRATKKDGTAKKSVRERYKWIREQYPEVMKRLDRHRTETTGVLEWRTPPKNVLLVNASTNLNTSALPHNAQKSSTPKECESSITVFKHPDVSAIDDRPASKMSHAYTIPDSVDLDRSSVREVEYYGDDFVSTHRRSRYARNRERAPSRGVRSEMGEVGPYGGPRPQFKDSFYAYGDLPAAYSSSSYAFNYYPSGRHSLGPVHGRYAQDQYASYAAMDQTIRRRPQSSFDAGAYSRYEQADSHYGVYDAYYARQKDDREKEANTSETDEGSLESDDEMAQIHRQQEMMRRSAAMHMGAMGAAGVATDPEERYYLGVIQLPQDRAQQLLYRHPPPAGYFHLPAIEKVAYLFYCALYRRHFQPVDVFHKRFNREYYNYTCDGDSSEVALWKICKHTQDEFNAKRSANHLKAYEMSQKQLFSDDRETPDSRISDRGSRCEHEEDSDRLSVDSALREPLKFRAPHSFVRFGIGGKVLVVDPSQSVSVVEIRDVKALVDDDETGRIVEAAESFKGPLVAGFTPTHSVRLYVQRQIERILKSDAYRANPSSGNANDALLIWQLLEMVVQQQGRVTGPDLSRLLMNGSHSFGRRAHGRDKTSPSLSPQPDERCVDPRAFEKFTQFLLGGHIDEAIESALKDGLYADAMVLARRVCAQDPRKLDKVEAAFLTHRAEQNPVMTLLSVANDLPAPILTNPPSDDSGSWRSHAAVVLANLNSPTAFNTIYHLGRVLARRDYHAAADFCFLAVNLLAGYDPFQPIVASEEDASVRQHITLIHASVPDDETDSAVYRCGFSLADLHATEIFEYAVRLANNAMPTSLSRSLDYEMCKLDYAELISECGGFSTDAFRYCVEVARAVWDRCGELSSSQLMRLCDLADRLQFVAGADASETAWIPALRSIIDQRVDQAPLMRPEDQQALPPTATVQQMAAQQYDIHEERTTRSAGQAKDVVAKSTVTHTRERTVSLSSEAADWHAEHQEPLQMAHVGDIVGEITPSQQQSAIESRQQNPLAVARSGNDRHQRHILQQRRITTSTTNANAAAQASYAFPPSVPETDEVPSMQQTKRESRSASISESLSRAPVDEPIQQTQTQGNRGYAADERRDSYADATAVSHRATFWQGDTPNGEAPPLSSVESSTGTTTTEESATTASSSVDDSPNRQSEMQHSNATLVTNISSYSTVNDSVFTAGATESFSTPPDNSLMNVPPKHPQSCSYEKSSETMPPIPAQPSSAPPTMEESKPVGKHEENSKHASLSGSSHHGGILSMLKAKIAKAIPTGNEMILPDDKNPSIVWDPVLNKYVGAGVEEETVNTPPPSTANSGVFDGPANGSSGGLRAARISGGSRYFNPLNEATSSSTQRISQSPVPVVTMPIPTTTFGFIPTMPDDESASADSPFSVNASPMETAAAAAQ
uniref:Protein transport protein sec16 n=1 Tax=Ascaris suum TaxID=6253 RepID=F1KPW1_ASCSU